MTIQISKVEMPKACISCKKFCPKGFAKDEYSPFEKPFNKPMPKTQYGKCEKTKSSVFATEICIGYEQEPNADVFDVSNRPEPKEQVTL